MKVRVTLFTLCLFLSIWANAEESRGSFSSSSAGIEISDLATQVSKMTGRKMILDSSVRGRISIIEGKTVSPEDAFRTFTIALAQNGFSYYEHGDYLVIAPSRNIQRNRVPLITQLPPLKEERIYTYMITLKHAEVADVNRNLRMLSSRDGELVPYEQTNTLFITDYLSALYRIDEILRAIDVPSTRKVTRNTKSDMKAEAKREAMKAEPTPSEKKAGQ